MRPPASYLEAVPVIPLSERVNTPSQFRIQFPPEHNKCSERTRLNSEKVDSFSVH